MRGRQSGFTLVEVIVTLAVISILVTLALPSFMGESRKSRAAAEVQPLFSDLRTAFERYLQENGEYPKTTGENAPHPALPSTTQSPLNPMPAAWTALRIRPSGPDEVYCSYTWSTGLANEATNIGAQVKAAPPAGFGFATPTVNWYYLLARCDMNGDGVFSLYFTSSVDPTIQKLNEGN